MQQYDRQEHLTRDINQLKLPPPVDEKRTDHHILPKKHHHGWENIERVATALTATALSLVLFQGDSGADATVRTPTPAPEKNELLSVSLALKNQTDPVREQIVSLSKADIDSGKVRSRLPAGVTLLTIDDGPHPRYTPQMLDLLDKYKMKATFFLLGSNVKAHPELVREIVRRGHEVAPHSMSHESLPGLSSARVKLEIQQSAQEIRKVLGADYPIRFFRAPYGNESQLVQRVASENGMGLVYWTVDTRDWDRAQSSSEYGRLVGTGEKDIVLLHDHGLMHPGRRQALEQALEKMKASGVQGKTLSQVFHPTGTRI